MFAEIIYILVIFLNLLFGIGVLIQNPSSNNHRFFSIISLLASTWTFSRYMTTISPSILWLQSSYSSGSLLMTIGLLWVLAITDNKLNKFTVGLIISISLLFSILSFQPEFITSHDYQIQLGAIFDGGVGWGLKIYSLYYFIIAFFILWKLHSAHNKSSDRTKKSQFKYIFIGALFTLTISAFSSFILPHFSIFLFDGVDSLGFLIFLTTIAYSITRYQLFDIRLILIQIIIFVLWIIVLIRIILSQNIQEVLTESILFTTTLLFGIILIRTSLREARQRELLRNLNLNLEQKVPVLTKELQKSYELEKKSQKRFGET